MSCKRELRTELPVSPGLPQQVAGLEGGPERKLGVPQGQPGQRPCPWYSRSRCQPEAALHGLALAAGWKELASYSPLSSGSPTQSRGTFRPHRLLQAPHSISLGLAS